MNDRAEFLAARANGLGGSDIASVLGISPWRTPLALYLEKRGEIPARPETAVQRRGKRLETLVGQMYAEDRHVELLPPAFVRGPEPWMLGNLDGTTIEPRVVEIKTASAFRRQAWGEVGSDEIPTYYTAQVQWYLALTKFKIADVATLIGGDDFRIYTVLADAEVQAMLIARAREFWQRVQDGRPPEPTTAADAALLYPRSLAGKAQPATDSDLADLAAIRGAQERINTYEAIAEEAKARLQGRLGEAEAIVDADGRSLCTWKTQERTTVDVKRLRAEHPAIAEAFARVNQSRVFRIA